MTRSIVAAAVLLVGAAIAGGLVRAFVSRVVEVVDDAVSGAFEDDEPVTVDEIQQATGARFLLAMSAASQKGDPEVLRFMEILKGGGVL